MTEAGHLQRIHRKIRSIKVFRRTKVFVSHNRDSLPGKPCIDNLSHAMKIVRKGYQTICAARATNQCATETGRSEPRNAPGRPFKPVCFNVWLSMCLEGSILHLQSVSGQPTAHFSSQRQKFGGPSQVFFRFFGKSGRNREIGKKEPQEPPERLAWHYHRCAATTDPFVWATFCLFDCSPPPPRWEIGKSGKKTEKREKEL